MDEQAVPVPGDEDTETVRLQAEEHPLIEDAPPATLSEHCLRLMHLRAYDEAVGHAAGRDVLDVGCNTGYGTMRFAPVAQRVVGVDVSPRAIEAARLRAPDGRPEFALTSGLTLPFADASFDLVTSFQVLEHVSDAIGFLRELERVLRPGGLVILATPNAATRLYPGMKPWNRFHVHEYVARELEERLGEVFATVSVLGMFGAPGLYETEIRRVDAARQRIRRKEEAANRQATRQAAREAAAAAMAARRAGRGQRSWPIRFARAAMPGFARAWLRSLVQPGMPTRAPRLPAEVVRSVGSAGSAAPTSSATPADSDAVSIDLEAFLRFSVDDLWYATSDLHRAMDLLAVCRVDPQPVTG